MLEVRVTINRGITPISLPCGLTLCQYILYNQRDGYNPSLFFFFHYFILHLSFKHQSKKPYHGLSSTREDSSDSRSDWTDDADDADDGRSIIGTDP